MKVSRGVLWRALRRSKSTKKARQFTQETGGHNAEPLRRLVLYSLSYERVE